jgi:mRNA interferase RelE/StbE
LSDDFKIAETSSFQKNINKLKYNKLYPKIKEYVYPILRKNPYFGPNIKRLKGTLAGIYRYRIGDYRLFYEIDEEKIIIFIIDIEGRKDAYTKK